MHDFAEVNGLSLEELIKLGWDVNLVYGGNTLLYYACLNNNEKAVEILLKYMKQIDPPNAVCLLCMSHNPNIARMFLSKNIDVHRLDVNGCCAPFYLIDVGKEKDNLAILSMLYDHGYDINFKDKNGKTTIEVFLSSIRKQYSIIEWLIVHGADTNSIIIDKSKFNGKSIKQRIIFDSKLNKKLAKMVQKYFI